MRIAISSTNPCHLYEMALALSQLESTVDYYSGYPAWKLNHHTNVNLNVISRSFRTLVTYGMLRLPENNSSCRWKTVRVAGHKVRPESGIGPSQESSGRSSCHSRSMP